MTLCLALFILLRFCHILVQFSSSDQSSVQKSTAQPFVTEAVLDSTSESELSASVTSLASLKPITSAVTSVIMSMAAAIKSAHDAAASALNHPQPSEDVVLASSDSILIVNSHDQPAVESAEDRSRNVRAHYQRSVSARLIGQVCKSWLHCHHRGWTCVTRQKMSSCLHQTSRHQVTHSTSRGSWRPRIRDSGSSSMMRSSSSISSIMCFKFLESKSQEVICSIERSIKAFRMQSIT